MSPVASINDDSDLSCPKCTITITIKATHLTEILAKVCRALALSGTRRLSIIVDASGSMLPESITVIAVLKLLRSEFRSHRVESISVHSKFRSTLGSAVAFIQGEHVVGLLRLDLLYDADDVTVPGI